MSFQGSTEVV